jgi:hypothetical protein
MPAPRWLLRQRPVRRYRVRRRDARPHPGAGEPGVLTVARLQNTLRSSIKDFEGITLRNVSAGMVVAMDSSWSAALPGIILPWASVATSTARC